MMKHLKKVFLFISLCMVPITALNAVDQKVVKKQAQAVQQTMACLQSRMGCTVEQLQRISVAMNNLNVSLIPLLSMAQFSKQAQSLQNTLNELQAALPSLKGASSEKKSKFISTVKKIAIAAIVLAGVAAAIGIGKAILGKKGQALEQLYARYNITNPSDKMFIKLVMERKIDEVNNYAQTGEIGYEALSAAISIIDSDVNYPDKTNLINMITEQINVQVKDVWKD